VSARKAHGFPRRYFPLFLHEVPALNTALEFLTRFAGLERAYGTYNLRKTKKVQRDGEKIVGKAVTV
jgi:hypothetical protein